MTGTQIITLARSLTATDSAQLPDGTTSTGGLLYANLVQKRIVDEINTRVNEDYFADVFSTDTVVGQNEYTLPVPATGSGIDEILGVSVKYDSDADYHTVARPERLFNVISEGQDISYFESNTPVADPFFIAFDTGLFLYPTPTEAIASGLKITATVNPVDLTLATEPIFLEKFHYIVAIGMKQYIYSAKTMIGEKNDAINEFNLELQRMVDAMNERNLSPIQKTFPSTSNFE